MKIIRGKGGRFDDHFSCAIQHQDPDCSRRQLEVQQCALNISITTKCYHTINGSEIMRLLQNITKTRQTTSMSARPSTPQYLSESIQLPRRMTTIRGSISWNWQDTEIQLLVDSNWCCLWLSSSLQLVTHCISVTVHFQLLAAASSLPGDVTTTPVHLITC